MCLRLKSDMRQNMKVMIIVIVILVDERWNKIKERWKEVQKSPTEEEREKKVSLMWSSGTLFYVLKPQTVSATKLK